jgi:hypothetical protein
MITYLESMDVTRERKYPQILWPTYTYAVQTNANYAIDDICRVTIQHGASYGPRGYASRVDRWQIYNQDGLQEW